MWVLPKLTGSHPWPLWSQVQSTDWILMVKNNAGLLVDKPYRIILKTYVQGAIYLFPSRMSTKTVIYDQTKPILASCFFRLVLVGPFSALTVPLLPVLLSDLRVLGCFASLFRVVRGLVPFERWKNGLVLKLCEVAKRKAILWL